MCETLEERALYEALGLRINWYCISEDEWQQMLKRNELSKQLENIEENKDELST